MKLALHWKILIGMALGIAWAIIAVQPGLGFDMRQFTLDWIKPFGEIFVRLLKMIAIPLVLFSIVAGIASMSDISKLGRIGGKTVAIYVGTTLVAVCLGLGVVNLLKPGEALGEEARLKNRIDYELWVESNPNVDYIDTFRYSSRVENLALVQEIKQDTTLTAAELEAKELAKKKEKSKSGPLQFIVDMVPDNIFNAFSDGKLMLQVIFFAIFLGITLLTLKNEHSEPVIKLVNGLSEAFIRMVELVMKGAPFFVFALMAAKLAEMARTPADVQALILNLGGYSGVVFTGLVIMAFGFYPMLLRLFRSGIGYVRFFKSISPAQLLAFSSSSSAATLPETMDCVENKIGVSDRVTSFVLPIGATVNMDGTSLYQAVAVIYLAQIHMIDLTFLDQLTIVLTATLASIGAAAVPSAGLVMLMVVLESLGLNPAWIAIILPVDRILDMCRTVVNVTGDAAVCTIVAKSEGELKDVEMASQKSGTSLE